MVLEEIWIFVQVDGLEGELAETLAAVGVGCGLGGDAAAAEFGTGAVLVVHWWCVEDVFEVIVMFLSDVLVCAFREGVLTL